MVGQYLIYLEENKILQCLTVTKNAFAGMPISRILLRRITDVFDQFGVTGECIREQYCSACGRKGLGDLSTNRKSDFAGIPVSRSF